MHSETFMGVQYHVFQTGNTRGAVCVSAAVQTGKSLFPSHFHWLHFIHAFKNVIIEAALLKGSEH